MLSAPNSVVLKVSFVRASVSALSFKSQSNVASSPESRLPLSALDVDSSVSTSKALWVASDVDVNPSAPK